MAKKEHEWIAYAFFNPAFPDSPCTERNELLAWSTLLKTENSDSHGKAGIWIVWGIIQQINVRSNRQESRCGCISITYSRQKLKYMLDRGGITICDFILISRVTLPLRNTRASVKHWTSARPPLFWKVSAPGMDCPPGWLAARNSALSVTHVAASHLFFCKFFFVLYPIRVSLGKP